MAQPDPWTEKLYELCLWSLAVVQGGVCCCTRSRDHDVGIDDRMDGLANNELWRRDKHRRLIEPVRAERVLRNCS